MNFLGDIFKRTHKRGPEQEGSSNFEKTDLHLPVIKAESVAACLAKKELLTPLELQEVQTLFADLQSADIAAMVFVDNFPGGELHLNNKSTNPKINLVGRKGKNGREVVIDQQQQHITSRVIFSEGLVRSGETKPRFVLEDENVDIDKSSMSVKGKTKTRVEYYSQGSLLTNLPQFQKVVITQNINGEIGQAYGNIQSMSVITSDTDKSVTTLYKDFMNMEAVRCTYDEYGTPLHHPLVF